MSVDKPVTPERTSPGNAIQERLDGDATRASLDTTGALPRTSSEIHVKKLEPIAVTAIIVHA